MAPRSGVWEAMWATENPIFGGEKSKGNGEFIPGLNQGKNGPEYKWFIQVVIFVVWNS